MKRIRAWMILSVSLAHMLFTTSVTKSQTKHKRNIMQQAAEDSKETTSQNLSVQNYMGDTNKSTGNPITDDGEHVRLNATEKIMGPEVISNLKEQVTVGQDCQMNDPRHGSNKTSMDVPTHTYTNTTHYDRPVTTGSNKTSMDDPTHTKIDTTHSDQPVTIGSSKTSMDDLTHTNTDTSNSDQPVTTGSNKALMDDPTHT
ncbi:unnamed protein product, partial [Owenia fusiformis]